MDSRPVVLPSSASPAELAKRLGTDLYLDGFKEGHDEELRKLGGAVIVCTTANGEAMVKPQWAWEC